MSDKESTPLYREYRRHKIEFSLSDLKFHVTGPEFEKLKTEYCIFPSFDEARVRIDKEADDSLRMKAKNLQFDETVLTENGDEATITKINRNDGNINGIEGHFIYPNIPWVAAALKRKIALRAELNEIESRISDLNISISRSYGRISADEYLKKVEYLLEAISKKREQALQNVPANNLTELKIA